MDRTTLHVMATRRFLLETSSSGHGAHRQPTKPIDVEAGQRGCRNTHLRTAAHMSKHHVFPPSPATPRLSLRSVELNFCHCCFPTTETTNMSEPKLRPAPSGARFYAASSPACPKRIFPAHLIIEKTLFLFPSSLLFSHYKLFRSLCSASYWSNTRYGQISWSQIN